MRLIDADALIKQQYEILGCDPMYYQGLEASKSQYLIEFLERAQTVDAVPVVRGEWIVDECDTSDDVPSYAWIEFHCSECNADYGLEEGQYSWYRYEKIPYNYCPNCGAKMGGEKHE